jgi:large subunit ribosomal protein L9
MKVILQEDVAHLGQTGQIVKVKDGFARNYLVPRGLALVADERNVKQLQHNMRIAQARAAKVLAVARDLAEKLATVAVSIKRESGEEGKLFGSVTNRDIAEALAAEGFEIDRRTIQLDEPIRSIGVFNVQVKLHPEVQTQAKVYVIQG